MAAARAHALAHPPSPSPLCSPHSLALRLPPSLARRSLNWIGLARHGASSQNYTRTQGIDIARRYTGAIAYPKTIDWRIVLPVYGTSNAMEIQFNWQREHRTCNDAFPFGLASSLRRSSSSIPYENASSIFTWVSANAERVSSTCLRAGIPVQSTAITRRSDGGSNEPSPWTISWLDGVRVRARKS